MPIDNVSETLKILDNRLFESSIQMSAPVLNKDLGTITYFASRYKLTNDKNHKNKCLKLLNELMSKFNDFDFESGILNGFEGVFWLFNYLEKKNVIDSSLGVLDNIYPSPYRSISIDIENNYFDLYSGSIGKIQCFLFNSDKIKKEETELINKLIDSLWNSKQTKNNQFYWLDREYDESLKYVDLGVAHGICSVLFFLGRLKQLRFENKKIDLLIDGVIETYFNAQNENIVLSSFANRYNINDKSLNDNYSRLGFCVGDLPISYGIYYVGIHCKNERYIKLAKKIISTSTYRGITDSGISEFPKYDFFDIGFCHGLGGIAFIYYRVNNWFDNELLKERSNFWYCQLLKNTEKVLEINEKIYFAKNYSYDSGKFIMDRYNFTDGLLGAALAILAIEYNDYSCFSFLGLY